MRWIKRTSMLEYTAANLMIEQWVPVKDIYFTEPFVPELFGDGAGVLDYYGIYPVLIIINSSPTDSLGQMTSFMNLT